MNKGRREEIKQLKYKKRVKVFADLEGKRTDDLIKSQVYIKWKADAKPCSCFMCRNQKYSRKGILERRL